MDLMMPNNYYFKVSPNFVDVSNYSQTTIQNEMNDYNYNTQSKVTVKK